MSKIFFLSIISLINISCSSDKINDCERFKQGVFKYIIKHGGDEIEITRSESMQKEFNKTTGSTTVSIIKWKKSCEYELTKTNEIKKLKIDSIKVYGEDPSSIPLVVKITGRCLYCFSRASA